MEPEAILIIDDDQFVTEAVTMLLDRPGLRSFVCSDLESAELVLAQQPISRVLTDVQFSGDFGFEGLHFLSRLHVRRPSCRIVLMTGLVTDALRAAAAGYGAAAVLAKPFAQRQLEDALELPHPCSSSPYETVHVSSLNEILRTGQLTTVFQPIVQRIDNGWSPFGYEALTRLRDPWPGGGVLQLFEYAEKLSRLVELNLAAMHTALSEARQLPPDAALFVNVDPVTFDHPDFVGAVQAAAARNDFPLSRLVLEITERSALTASGGAARVFKELRASGVRLALDDHGSAHSHLTAISDIEPSFIKISQSFGTDFERDTARERVVRHVLALSRDFGCRTILEGVETLDTAGAASAQGVELAQGYLFGRPGPASQWRDTSVAA